MVCLGLEPGAASLKAQTNPLSYNSKSLTTIQTAILSNFKSYLNASTGQSFICLEIEFLFPISYLQRLLPARRQKLL